MKINPEKLKSDVKYEEAAPEEGAGKEHLNTSNVFPHIYGPVDNEAVEGIGELGNKKGKYCWPVKFIPFTEYLETNKKIRE